MPTHDPTHAPLRNSRRDATSAAATRPRPAGRLRRLRGALTAAVCAVAVAVPAGLAPGNATASPTPTQPPASADVVEGDLVGATYKRFAGGERYDGAFPDPELIKVGNRYYGYATTASSKTLPIIYSTDARTWRARPSYDRNKWWDNDGMRNLPKWTTSQLVVNTKDGSRFVQSWAPSVEQAPDGGWVAAYSAPHKRKAGKRCISIARARHPMGPYTDFRPGPVTCGGKEGAIDPYVFRSGKRTYLLWKTEGTPYKNPTRIWVRELNRNGTKFKPGTRSHALLKTKDRWEGSLIENPAMIRYAGKLYLFYSANLWWTNRYAVGYAICKTQWGPCHRPSNRPLLASGAGVAGPGGPAPVRGPRGELLLGYAAWQPANVTSTGIRSCGSCGGRQLYIARIATKNKQGHLRLVNRFWYRP